MPRWDKKLLYGTKGCADQVLQLATEAISKDDIGRKIVVWGKKLLYGMKRCADQVLQLAAEAMSKDYRNLCLRQRLQTRIRQFLQTNM